MAYFVKSMRRLPIVVATAATGGATAGEATTVDGVGLVGSGEAATAIEGRTDAGGTDTTTGEPDAAAAAATAESEAAAAAKVGPSQWLDERDTDVESSVGVFGELPSLMWAFSGAAVGGSDVAIGGACGASDLLCCSAGTSRRLIPSSSSESEDKIGLRSTLPPLPLPVRAEEGDAEEERFRWGATTTGGGRRASALPLGW